MLSQVDWFGILVLSWFDVDHLQESLPIDAILAGVKHALLRTYFAFQLQQTPLYPELLLLLGLARRLLRLQLLQ